LALSLRIQAGAAGAGPENIALPAFDLRPGLRYV
jgi:hypothetical protein